MHFKFSKLRQIIAKKLTVGSFQHVELPKEIQHRKTHIQLKPPPYWISTKEQ